MKQKYTVTVAGTELNIISDATPEEVGNIADAVDRRMRDINLKSPRCSRTEAATLCALSFCSEQIAMQQSFKKLERDASRYSAEIERLKKSVETLQKEKDLLEEEAASLRAALSAKPPVPDEQDEPSVEAPTEENAPAGENAEEDPKKPRVGGMFGLLTYHDV